jgi:hypothetical protein
MFSSSRYRARHLYFGATALTLLMLAGTQSLRADGLISVAFNIPNSFGAGGPSPVSGPESSATSANSLFGAANDWNHLNLNFGVLTTNPGWTNLVNSAGAATGVDFSITGTVLPVNLYPFNPSAYGSNTLLSQFVGWNSCTAGGCGAGAGESTSISWTISGLAPNTTYNMFVYGAIADQSRSFDMTIAGTTINVPTYAYGSPIGPTGVNFVNVVSNSQGDISGVGTGVGSSVGTMNEANWSGFQLVQVPEPSSLVLLGTGLFGLLGTFKKKLSR